MVYEEILIVVVSGVGGSMRGTQPENSRGSVKKSRRWGQSVAGTTWYSRADATPTIDSGGYLVVPPNYNYHPALLFVCMEGDTDPAKLRPRNDACIPGGMTSVD